MFQLTFAVVTTALLSGAIADRTKFSAWIVFVIAWSLLVYVPAAHWAFSFDGGQGGWIGDRLGALDFAGGTAVEINSGASALALALVVGKRIGFRRDPMRPHNLPLVLLGAALAWGLTRPGDAGPPVVPPAPSTVERFHDFPSHIAIFKIPLRLSVYAIKGFPLKVVLATCFASALSSITNRFQPT
jgi:hypothetical protein